MTIEKLQEERWEEFNNCQKSADFKRFMLIMMEQFISQAQMYKDTIKNSTNNKENHNNQVALLAISAQMAFYFKIFNEISHYKHEEAFNSLTDFVRDNSQLNKKES